MANHKSAEKRARQSLRRKSRNNQAKASVRTFERNLIKGIESKSKDAAELLGKYTAQAMKIAGKGQLKKSTIARKISRLSKRVQAALTK